MRFGLVLAALALALVGVSGGVLTAGLGALALASYVLVYTPLKRLTPAAVLVGAVPGAIPPLMGHTAAAGAVEPTGLFLAGILFAWQLPHFLAISLYLEDDYRRGGLRVLPVVRGKSNGKLGVGGAIWGRERVAERFAAMVARRLDPSRRWRLMVGHCDCAEDGVRLRDALRERIPHVERDWLLEAGVAIGSHAGPGSLVVGAQEALPLRDPDA